MKCPICGFEMEKPNQKTCPLCGHKITPRDFASDEGTSPQDATSEILPNVEGGSNVMQQMQPVVQQETAMVECPICSSMVRADANFCPRCGHNMHEKPEKEQLEISNISEPEQLMRDAGHEEPRETTNVNPVIAEEIPSVPQPADYYRNEDTDEYIANGLYIPCPEEEQEYSSLSDGETSDKDKSSSVSHVVTYILTAIVSTAFGVALYYMLT